MQSDIQWLTSTNSAPQDNPAAVPDGQLRLMGWPPCSVIDQFIAPAANQLVFYPAGAGSEMLAMAEWQFDSRR